MTKYPNAIQNGVLAPKTVSVIYSFQYVRCFAPTSAHKSPPSRPSSHHPQIQRAPGPKSQAIPTGLFLARFLSHLVDRKGNNSWQPFSRPKRSCRPLVSCPNPLTSVAAETPLTENRCTLLYGRSTPPWAGGRRRAGSLPCSREDGVDIQRMQSPFKA